MPRTDRARYDVAFWPCICGKAFVFAWVTCLERLVNSSDLSCFLLRSAFLGSGLVQRQLLDSSQCAYVPLVPQVGQLAQQSFVLILNIYIYKEKKKNVNPCYCRVLVFPDAVTRPSEAHCSEALTLPRLYAWVSAWAAVALRTLAAEGLFSQRCNPTMCYSPINARSVLWHRFAANTL